MCYFARFSGRGQSRTPGLSLELRGMVSVDAFLNQTADLTLRRFVWIIRFCCLLPSTKFDSRVCLQTLPPSAVANHPFLLTYSASVLLSSCCALKACLPCEQLLATLFCPPPHGGHTPLNAFWAPPCGRFYLLRYLHLCSRLPLPAPNHLPVPFYWVSPQSSLLCLYPTGSPSCGKGHISVIWDIALLQVSSWGCPGLRFLSPHYLTPLLPRGSSSQRLPELTSP